MTYLCRLPDDPDAVEVGTLLMLETIDLKGFVVYARIPSPADWKAIAWGARARCEAVVRGDMSQLGGVP